MYWRSDCTVTAPSVVMGAAGAPFSPSPFRSAYVSTPWPSSGTSRETCELLTERRAGGRSIEEARDLQRAEEPGAARLEELRDGLRIRSGESEVERGILIAVDADGEQVQDGLDHGLLERHLHL